MAAGGELSGGVVSGDEDGLITKNMPTTAHKTNTAASALALADNASFLFRNIGILPFDCGGISSGKVISFDMIVPFFAFCKFYSRSPKLITYFRKIKKSILIFFVFYDIIK